MIEVSVGRKGVEHLFPKYIGVFGVLGGEDYIVLIGGNSELSREGGFLNVLIVERDGLVYPVYPRVMFCQPQHS